MTTNYPGKHYFSVDVETSALRPDEGSLLSIGTVVLDELGNVVDTQYIRIRQPLERAWYDDSLPPCSETCAWWREQNEYARNEAYLDRSLKRETIYEAAYQFTEFVLQYGEEWTDRLFVANPVQFDWAWTLDLLMVAAEQNPFWYHGIDLWSLAQGKYSVENGGILDTTHRVRGHEPVAPHHPLSDAFAQAQDLADFLAKDIIELDYPYLEGYDDWLADQAALAATTKDDDEEAQDSTDEEAKPEA